MIYCKKPQYISDINSSVSEFIPLQKMINCWYYIKRPWLVYVRLYSIVEVCVAQAEVDGNCRNLSWTAGSHHCPAFPPLASQPDLQLKEKGLNFP